MNNDIKAEIGNRLRMLRIGRKETQKELGDLLGITPAAYGKIESGDRGLSSEYCIDLAKHYNVSCDYILRGVEAADLGADTAKAAEINKLNRIIEDLKWMLKDFCKK